MHQYISKTQMQNMQQMQPTYATNTTNQCKQTNICNQCWAGGRRVDFWAHEIWHFQLPFTRTLWGGARSSDRMAGRKPTRVCGNVEPSGGILPGTLLMCLSNCVSPYVSPSNRQRVSAYHIQYSTTKPVTCQHYPILNANCIMEVLIDRTIHSLSSCVVAISHK